jgi:hypothetical protein
MGIAPNYCCEDASFDTEWFIQIETQMFSYISQMVALNSFQLLVNSQPWVSCLVHAKWQVAATLISCASVTVIQKLHHVIHIAGVVISYVNPLGYQLTPSDTDKIHEKFGEHNKTAKSVTQKMCFFLYESPFIKKLQASAYCWIS